MGIHGLTSFIDNNPHLLKDCRLHDCRVVIDGNNFYHFLYFYCNVRFQFGGDYDTFQRKIAMIFSLFKSCNIEPFVIFDGAYTVDGKKLKTSMSRARDRVRAAQRIMNGNRGALIPCLAQVTFRQTLDMLGVRHVTCDFEADNQVVTLANQWNCPVISNDSDFYIFDLSAGFIPLDYIDFRLCKFPGDSGNSTESYTFLAAQFYHVDEFIRCFKSLSRSVLPLFATMLGNDYVDAAAFEIFYNKKTPKAASRRYAASKKHAKIVSVLYWLEEKGSLEEILPEVLTFIRKERREKVEKLLTNSIRGYVETQDFESFNLREYLEGRSSAATEKTDFVRGCHGDVMPSWFLADLRSGKIPAFLLNVALLHRIILQTQVESVSMSASFLPSTALRQVIYGIIFHDRENPPAPQSHTDGEDLFQTPQDGAHPVDTVSVDKSTVVEYTRHNLELRKILLQPCRGLQRYGDLPTLESIPQLSLENRQAIVTESLGLSEEFASKFEPSIQLFAMCVVFWMRNASPRLTYHHVRGILLSVILLHVHKEIQDREEHLLGQNNNVSETKQCLDGRQDDQEKSGNPQSLDVTKDSQEDCPAQIRSSAAESKPFVDEDNSSDSKRGIEALGKHLVGKPKGKDVLSVTAVCSSLSCDILRKVRENLRKYYHEPVKINSKSPPDHPTFHGTAQFLACLLDSVHLNSLLQCPFPSPQPSLLFNGTFVYSIVLELQNRTNPDLFLLEMLVKGSPLASLFDSWCSLFLAEAREDAISTQKVQGKKCCRSAKRKKKKEAVADQGQGQDSHLRDSVSADGQAGGKVVAACDLSNRFGALMLEEAEDE
ncbi:hypothetical protein BaRGS_00008561 [Batillaria attramentaria]|uniref:XPG N-terminal domain-containing protein n=1 Tax=Batillaria attramentaria TaxID=370345 RepID=A0ABD0LMB5_9CAEN